MGGRMIVIAFRVKVAEKLFGRCLEVRPAWSVCDGPPCLLALGSAAARAAGWGFLEKQRLKGVNAFKQT